MGGWSDERKYMLNTNKLEVIVDAEVRVELGNSEYHKFIKIVK